ncbi:MAG: response regulator [Zoogloeaceae bacterium]|jgi:signal transduction histidine kinase/CheY-like chemotaxis protein|nr:response regulator [Zoogloeaceae bacterium]
MGIKLKIFCSIMVIVLAVVVLGIGFSLMVSQERLRATLENDMTLVARLASKMVSNRLMLLKSEARSVIVEVRDLPTKALPEVLEVQLDRYDYLAIAVFERDELVVVVGDEAVAMPDLRDDTWRRAALGGEIVISPLELNGDSLVFRIYAKVGDRVLAFVVPGLSFADLLAEFQVLGTDSLIFVLGADGSVQASPDQEALRQHRNYVHSGDGNSSFQEVEASARRMMAGESGVSYYTFNHLERMCAFLPVPGSEGWSLGVAVSLKDTALYRTRNLLLYTAFVLLLLGVLAALFATRRLVRPFDTIARQNAELVELKQAADQASEAKSRFIANTSHEIRTPLNAIIGFSELALGEKDLPGAIGTHLENIYGAGVGLLGIINDLLDISKIEAGKFELVPVEYDVPSMINDTRSLNLLRIVDKPIRFLLSVDEDVPARLRGDEVRVKQIFNNLLSNAFKYTRQGEVEWSISCQWEGNAVWLTSHVRDTGIGIREEDLGKLFASYSQVDTKSNRKIEGTGLGLAIARRLANMMQGDITVQSRYGEGSVFTVRIRQEFVSEVAIGAEVAKNLKGFKYVLGKRERTARLVRIRLPEARVLVVDDLQTNLDVARGIMKPYGMQVDCVLSGAEAIRAVKEEKTRYDAIFMDHMMPEMDGIEATRRIRELGTDYAKQLPIIALTANAIAGNEAMFLEHGFQDFLSKPIDLLLMDAVLRHWVRDGGAHRAAEDSPAQEAEEAETPPPETAETRNMTEALRHIDGLDWEEGCAHLGGDASAYIEILRSWLRHTPELREKIQTPQAETLPDYVIHVHGIKGSSYGVGARRVGVCAEALEDAARHGDIAFVREKTPELLALLDAMLLAITAVFQKAEAADTREFREKPDPALLRTIFEAARDYDEDALKAALARLETFHHAAEGEALVCWLREAIEHLEFSGIQERLKGALAAEDEDSHRETAS